MPRRAKADAEKTRARILASALTLFVKKGYENTTLNDIAARLKMTKGAVYWHFASKSDLLAALLDEAMARFSTKFDELMEGKALTFPAVAKMLAEIAGRIVADRGRSDFFMLMHTGLKWTDAKLAPMAQKLITERVGPHHAVVDAIDADIAAARVRPEVDTQQIAVVVMSIWDGAIRRKIEGFLPADVSDMLENAFGIIWDGIRV
jgi:TetR/AcrR family acrAB operon transcriptional repressor